MLSHKLPRGQLGSNPAGDSGEYVRAHISGDSTPEAKELGSFIHCLPDSQWFGAVPEEP